MIDKAPENTKKGLSRIDYEGGMLPVFELYPDAIAILDEKQNVFRVNRLFQELFGYEPDEIVGKSIELIVPEELGEESFSLADKTLHGEEIALETVRRRKDGTLIPVLIRGFPIELEDGRKLITAIYSDISRRKKAEKELLEEKNRAQTYLDTAAVMLLVLDEAGCVSLINRKGCEILECAEEEVLGRNWFETFLPVNSRTEVGEVFKELMAGRSELVEHYENPIVAANGQEKMIAWYNTLTRDEEGTIRGVLSSGEDVTERRRAEAAIRESEERYRSLTDNLNVGVYRSTVGPTGEFIEANPAIVQMFGFSSKEEFLATKVVDLYRDPEDRVRFNQKMLEHGFVRDEELLLRKKDGTDLIVSVSAVAVTDDYGETKFFNGIVEDITEKKRLQEQLNFSQKLESVGRLTAGIAHDFNNLLTVIGGNTELLSLSSGVEEGSAEADRLENIRTATARATGLIGKLMSFSRQQLLMPRIVDLTESIEGLKSILRKTVKENIEVEYTLCSDPVPVEVDPVQIERVVLDIAMNAGEAMPGGGVLKIEVESFNTGEGQPGFEDLVLDEGRYAVLSISDTGEAIPQEELDHIFEPHFESIEIGKGKGFIIPSVYGFVKQSGGEMKADSIEGVGTTIRIFLPLYEEEDGEVPAPPEGLGPAGSGETVLVVEDEDGVRKLTVDLLRGSGYRVLEASDGFEALDLFEKEDIDLLVTDAVMPGMGGIELSGTLKEREMGVRAIIISGYPGNEIIGQEGTDTGSVFLQKPFRPIDLVNLVRETLGQ